MIMAAGLTWPPSATLLLPARGRVIIGNSHRITVLLTQIPVTVLRDHEKGGLGQASAEHSMRIFIDLPAQGRGGGEL